LLQILPQKEKSNAEYIKMVEQWQATDDVAIKQKIEEELIASVELLIHKTCYKHTQKGKHALEDLKQESYLGVLKTFEKWNSEKAKNSKFVSYMMMWVTAYIYNYLSKNSGDVRVPKKNIEKALRDIKEEGQISEQNKKYTTSYVYLDKERASKEEIDTILYNEFSKFSSPAIIARNRERDTQTLARQALESLKEPRLREVLRLRSEGATLEEIGIKLGLAGERIRQLEARAYFILRCNKKLMTNIRDWAY
jgi:RNA polymerase sigma factor (sigma-70 family)